MSGLAGVIVRRLHRVLAPLLYHQVYLVALLLKGPVFFCRFTGLRYEAWTWWRMPCEKHNIPPGQRVRYLPRLAQDHHHNRRTRRGKSFTKANPRCLGKVRAWLVLGHVLIWLGLLSRIVNVLPHTGVCVVLRDFEFPVVLTSPSVPVDTAVTVLMCPVDCVGMIQFDGRLYYGRAGLAHCVPRASEMTASVFLNY